MKTKFYFFFPLILVLHAQNAFSQWTETNGTITASFTNTAAAWEGKVYFTGGPKTQFVTVASYNNKVEVLDLETGVISTAPANTSPGRCAIGGVAYNGKIYFAGGHKWTSTAPGLQLFNQLDIFDVATQTWEYSHLPVAKTSFATAVVNGKILFAGGYVKVGNQIVPTAEVNVLDPSNGSWSVMQLSQARGELSAGVIGNKVWFCGGQTSWTIWAASSRVDVYDADLNQWTDSELSMARAYASVATVGQYMICAGGYTNTVGYSNQVDMFDTLNGGVWSTATLSAPRFGIAAATVGNKAYFTGGGHLDLSASYYDQSSNIVDIFDATNGAWSTGNLVKNRMTHACAAWGNKIAVGGGWRAEQSQTTGSVEILTDASAVAVPELMTSSLVSVFPNPASNVLNVSLSESHPLVGNASLLVVDLYGKIVLQKDLVLDDWQKNITFSLNEIPPGGYFLILDAGERGKAFRRFVVLR